MIRAHQPGSQPIDIPEAIPNPAAPQAVPTPAPKEPLPVPQRGAGALHASLIDRGMHAAPEIVSSRTGRLPRMRTCQGPRPGRGVLANIQPPRTQT
jgi:hypothetical protein